jgi:ABC-type transport system involved in multi-copper enzyme maturation permease subunit
MLRSLVWREIRGLIRTPYFYLSCAFVLIVMASTLLNIGRPGFRPQHLGVWAYFGVVWCLLIDTKTREIQWLFRLPVKRRTVFLAKYLAGLPFVVLFVLLTSEFVLGADPTAIIPLSPPVRLGLYVLYYSFAFVAAKLSFDAMEPR